MNKSRRKILNTLFNVAGLGVAGTILYPITKYLIPPKITEPKTSMVKAGSVNEFEINSSKIIKFGRRPVILIRKENGEFIALEATCTHLDCIVQYRKDKKQIICACHNGVYDLLGRNVSGPPPKPLTEFSVKIVNDEIIITS